MRSGGLCTLHRCLGFAGPDSALPTGQAKARLGRDGRAGHRQTRRCAAAFQPEVAAGAATTATASADPLVAKGSQILRAHARYACHGKGAVGRAAAPRLTGIHQKLSPDQLTALLNFPSAQMTAGGMPPVKLPPDDTKALVAYIESL